MRKKIGISLLFDEDAGEGSLKIRPTFADNNVLLQIDCLQDWIGELTTLYNYGLAEFRTNGSYSRNLLEVEEAHDGTDRE